MSQSNPPIPLVPYTSAAYGEMDGVYQPAWNVSEDTRGLLEGSVTYRKQVEPMNPRLPALPGRGEPHPWDTRLKCYQSQMQFGENGQCMVTANYIGLVQDPTLAEMELSASTTTQNLQLHPNFVNIAMSTPPDATNSNFEFFPYVNTVNDNGKDFERFDAVTAPEGLKGASDYHAPRATVRVSFYTGNQGVVSKYLSNVGTYSTDIPNSNGPLPKGGDFLLTNVGLSVYGTIYKVSAEWVQSEQGSTWSRVIYRGFGNGGKAGPAKKYTLGANFNIGAKWEF